VSGNGQRPEFVIPVDPNLATIRRTLSQTCGICGESDLPPTLSWLWWLGGQPIHPWCDADVWGRLDVATRRKIKAKVDELYRQARRGR
jgi:hypothetical protein